MSSTYFSKWKIKQSLFFLFMQVFRFYHTIRHLRIKQICYRIYYAFKRRLYIQGIIPQDILSTVLQHQEIRFAQAKAGPDLYSADHNTFCLLNKEKSFGAEIDWAFRGYGLLWSFHLHYFNWLSGLSEEKGLSMLSEYIDNHTKGYFFNHSYISSIRMVNWIKFCLERKIKEAKVYICIYRQAHRLAAFPEYELMGNHLMENGIALVWAGLFFKEDRFRRQGERILRTEFRDQILADGAHFEKSISYHTILLKRLLELTNYYRHFDDSDKFYKQLIFICSKMLSYVFVLTDKRDFLPLFGDSNEGMTISADELKSLAQDLHLKEYNLPLGASGIRKMEGERFSLFFNLGNIPAVYQPGHTHADAFSICLNEHGKPVITDCGVSTYERNEKRREERSTMAHNTISVERQNSSDVWASFRIGKRAECNWLIDSGRIIDCEHNGYNYKYKITHKRRIFCEDKQIIIEDRLIGWKGQEVMISFHLYPGIQVELNSEAWLLNNENISITIDGADTILEHYDYAKSFNITVPAKRISGIATKETIRTIIVFK